MTTPTSKALEEAVERAAEAAYDADMGHGAWKAAVTPTKTYRRAIAHFGIAAAFPGLFDGTMWLAPWEADASMIGRALPLVNEITADDKRVGAEACMRLTAGRPMAREGDAVIFAAQLRTDFRAMRDAYLNAERKE